MGRVAVEENELVTCPDCLEMMTPADLELATVEAWLAQ